jgi:hypothetical protein
MPIKMGELTLFCACARIHHLSGSVLTCHPCILSPETSRYIEFDEMQIMAAQLGAPFKSEKEARKTWQQMDTDQTGRVKEEQFVEWWYNKEQDVLRKKLSRQLGFSTEKLGKGAKSRGVVFG